MDIDIDECFNLPPDGGSAQGNGIRVTTTEIMTVNWCGQTFKLPEESGVWKACIVETLKDIDTTYTYTYSNLRYRNYSRGYLNTAATAVTSNQTTPTNVTTGVLVDDQFKYGYDNQQSETYYYKRKQVRCTAAGVQRYSEYTTTTTTTVSGETEQHVNQTPLNTSYKFWAGYQWWARLDQVVWTLTTPTSTQRTPTDTVHSSYGVTRYYAYTQITWDAILPGGSVSEFLSQVTIDNPIFLEGQVHNSITRNNVTYEWDVPLLGPTPIHP